MSENPNLHHHDHEYQHEGEHVHVYQNVSPLYTTTYTQGPSVVYGGQTVYSTLPQDYKILNQTLQTNTGSYSRIGQTGQTLVQKVVAEQIPVQSRIQYIPFEKKYVEYDQVQTIQRIPFEREIVEYEEVTRTERVPVQKTITDYYAVETQIQYIPKEIQQTIVEYEPVERVYERIQYLPVETQIVHYPQKDNYVPGQGKYIKAGYVEGGYNTGYTTTTHVHPTEVVHTDVHTYVGGRSGVVTGSHVHQGVVQGSHAQYVYNGPTYTGQQTYVTGGSSYVTGHSHVGKQTYVTGGSGVRGGQNYRASQTGGYVTGGSGVRH